MVDSLTVSPGRYKRIIIGQERFFAGYKCDQERVTKQSSLLDLNRTSYDLGPHLDLNHVCSNDTALGCGYLVVTTTIIELATIAVFMNTISEHKPSARINTL